MVMSNTHIHKEHIKESKGLICKPSERLHNKWDRYNDKLGEGRYRRNKKTLKAIQLADNL